MNGIDSHSFFNVLMFLNNEDIIALSLTNKFFRNKVISNSNFLLNSHFKKEISPIQFILLRLPTKFNFDLYVYLTKKYQLIQSYFIEELKSNYQSVKFYVPYFTQNQMFHLILKQFYIQVNEQENIYELKTKFIDYIYFYINEFHDISLLFYILSQSNLSDFERMNKNIYSLKSVGLESLFNFINYHEVSNDSLVLFLRLLPLIVNKQLTHFQRFILFNLLKINSSLVRNECECCIKLLLKKDIIKENSIPFVLRRKIIGNITVDTQQRIDRKLNLKRKTQQCKQPLLQLRNSLHSMLETINN